MLFSGPTSREENKMNSQRNKTQERKPQPRLFQLSSGCHLVSSKLNAENWPLNRRALIKSKIQGCILDSLCVGSNDDAE